MRKFTPRILILAIAMACAATAYAESGFIIGLEANRGGNNLYPDQQVEVQAHQREMREGDNLTAKVGYQLGLGDYLALRGTVGYAWSSENKFETETSHVPIEALAFIRINKKHYVGFGPVIHYNRTINSVFDWNAKGAGGTPVVAQRTSFTSKDEFGKGAKLEYNYATDSGVYFGVQYTYMRYQYDQKYYLWEVVASDSSTSAYHQPMPLKNNASSGGITIGYRF